MSDVERQRQLARELAQVVRSYDDLRESAIGQQLFSAWIDVLGIANEDEAISVFATYLNDVQIRGNLQPRKT